MQKSKNKNKMIIGEEEEFRKGFILEESDENGIKIMKPVDNSSKEDEEEFDPNKDFKF